MKINEQLNHDTYNEGFIHYGRIAILRNKLEEKIGETFEELGKLAFARVTIRDNDNIIADSLGYTINEKIKVPYRELPNNIKIKINDDDELYDVVKKDTSDRKKLFIYLQKITNKKEVDNE